MKLDAELIQIATNKPSDTDLPETVNAVFQKAGTNLTDAEKIAAFDEMAAKIAQLWGQNEEAHDGVIYENSDNPHYLFEAVLEAVMGKNIWDAYNAIFESC